MDSGRAEIAFVVDASVALAWVLNEADEYADKVLTATASESASVPVHWALEVANGLLMAERRGRITALEASSAYRSLVALGFSVDNATLDQLARSTIDLALEHGLTIYDAAYLELAARHALPIASLDRRMKEAMSRTGIPEFKP